MSDKTTKPTPSALSKKGGLSLKQVAEHSGKTRQWLNWQFEKDQDVFKEILFNAMRKQCAIDIQIAMEKIQTMQPECESLISLISNEK